MRNENNIIQLTDEVFTKVAAGEVIERDASVVKELVENAIDAGSTQITVEVVSRPNERKIIVTDNGCGIRSEQLFLAFKPHATSKIRVAEDLFGVATLGFRGEALASIAAVSKVKITTNTNENDLAAVMQLDGGIVKSTGFVAANKGTRIEIANLFYNTPVRLRFLRKTVYEDAETTSTVSKLILANPSVKFCYRLNDVEVFRTNGNGSDEAVYITLGTDYLANSIKIDKVWGKIHIHGYVGIPEFYKSNSLHQIFILNGRFIRDKKIAAAVKSAYSEFILKNRYAFCVLYIDVPSAEIDVNVHPGKLEVRFADGSAIFSAVRNPIYDALSAAARDQMGAILSQRSAENAGSSAINIAAAPTLSSQQQQKQSYSEPAAQDAGSLLENARKFFDSRSSVSTEECLSNIKAAAPSTSTAASDSIALQSSQQVSLPDIDPTFDESTAQSVVENADLSEIFRNRVDFSGDPTKGIPDRAEDFLGKPTLLDYSRIELDKDGNLYNLALQQNLEKYSSEDDSVDGTTGIGNIARSVFSGAKLIGFLFRTYILLEKQDFFIIVDQHAAHERILYDKFVAAYERSDVVVQQLLEPFKFEARGVEIEYIECNEPLLRRAGFKIVKFEKRDVHKLGELNFELQAVPMEFGNMHLGSFVHYLLSGMNRANDDYRLMTLDVLARRACKASVRGGDKVDEQSVFVLLKLLEKCTSTKCPHGRPIFVVDTRMDFEKRFKRYNP